MMMDGARDHVFADAAFPAQQDRSPRGRDALDKLEQLGLLRRDGKRLIVAAFDEAFSKLRGVWDSLFPLAAAGPAP